jgi:hypothetical protein
VVVATQDTLLAGVLTGGAVLLLILLLWIALHHAKPGMRIDIGVRGWVSLKPAESEQEEPKAETAEGSGDDGRP